MQMRLATRSPSRASLAIVRAGRVGIIWLALAVIAGAAHPLDGGRLLAVTLAAAIWLVALRTAFANAPAALGPWVPAAVGSTTGLVGVAALNPLLLGLHLPVTALLGMWTGVFLSAGLWESVVSARVGRRRVLVIGSSALKDISSAVDRSRALPFKLLDPPDSVHSALAGPSEALMEHDAAAAAVIPVADLALIVAEQRPDLIVLTDEDSWSDTLDRLLEISDRRFRVAGLTSFYEYAFGCVPLLHLTPAWFMSLLHFRQRSPRRPSKRAFDVVVAVAGLVVTALLFPILALLIKRTPGPVIYRQTRVGESGRLFTMYKFRTMCASAEPRRQAVWAQDGDPRCTPVGRLLRHAHLDELPQLWNVLRGDMSVVGPRPERPEFIELLEENVPFWGRRLLTRPGMTGWAQVHCGYAADSASAAEKLSYDFWYLRYGNLAVDVAVCLRTAGLVLEILDPRPLLLRRRGASERSSR
jgi:lipopolysaccharide/colanic/teichoic acid biosynthesis glycosyltransferase